MKIAYSGCTLSEIHHVFTLAHSGGDLPVNGGGLDSIHLRSRISQRFVYRMAFCVLRSSVLLSEGISEPFLACGFWGQSAGGRTGQFWGFCGTGPDGRRKEEKEKEENRRQHSLFGGLRVSSGPKPVAGAGSKMDPGIGLNKRNRERDDVNIKDNKKGD